MTRDLSQNMSGGCWFRKSLNTHSPQTSSQLNTMSFPTQDEDRDHVVYAYSKPNDARTFAWVKRRMRLLEVRGRLEDRFALFDEFFLHTPIKGF